MQFECITFSLSHSRSDVTGRQSSNATTTRTTTTTTNTTTMSWRAEGGCRTAHVLRVARTNFECGSDSARVASPCGSLVCLRQFGSLRVASAWFGCGTSFHLPLLLLPLLLLLLLLCCLRRLPALAACHTPYLAALCSPPAACCLLLLLPFAAASLVVIAPGRTLSEIKECEAVD